MEAQKEQRQQHKEYDACAKVCIIGPEGSGKSCLAANFIDGAFSEMPPTIGVDFRIHSVQLDGLQTRLHLWDTTGAERFSKITHAYYRVAHGICVVYDMADPATLDKASDWLEQVRRYASDDVATVLVGTKLDRLSDKERQRICCRANQIATTARIPHVQTSAKTGQGVRAAFETVVREVRAAASDRRTALQVSQTNAAWSALAALSVKCSPESCCMPWATWLRASTTGIPTAQLSVPPAMLHQTSKV